MKNGLDSNDPHKNPMSGPNLTKEPKSDRKSLANPQPNRIANYDSSVLITDNPVLCDEDRGAVAASESIISSKLDKNQEVSKDHGLLLGLSESQALNQAFLDPESSSRVSLFQNEPFATENLQNRIDSDSFFQELDRFKKNFKKTFEDDSSPPSASENANKDDIFRYNLIHPSQHFGIDSFSSKPNSLAVNLLQNKKHIKSESQRSSSISLNSSPEGITSQSTVKRRGNPLFMLKNLYSRPGLKKKQAMVLNIGLNGNTDIGCNTGITSNGENDCVQSLDTSYDNNLKDLEEDYVETVGYDKIVSYDTDQEKCLKSQETFSYMQTDNSVLRTKNVVEVLEHIENQNPVVVDSTKAQFSSSGFESLLERLENRHKQKNRQSAFFENDSLLRRINVSAYDISIDSNSYIKQEKETDQNMRMNKKASSQMTLLRNESSFVTKYDLRLEVDSQNQQATEDDRVATEGNDTLSNFDLDVDLNDLNQSFMNSSNCNSKQIRIVQVRKHERHKSQQDPNHSCVLPQTDPLKIVHHKTRIYKPFIRPREQKLTTAWSQQYSAKEIIKVSDEKEAEYSLNNSLGNVGSPQKNNARCIRNKPGRSLKEYLAFSLKADQDGHERPLSRQKKAIIRNVQLDMCYGQLLKVGTQERGKKK